MLDNREIAEIFERFEIENPNPESELIAPNEYTFAIAVLLSAQTTDKAVNKATKLLFEKADTPEKMLALGLEGVKEHIKTLGLYNNKAKNVILFSEMLVKNYESKLPRNRDELEKLPGIGRKSANVIANRLFGSDHMAVDTHVLRLANRIGLSKSKNPLGVETDLIKVVPQKYQRNASDWLVLHGRYVCLAKKPKCSDCFLQDLCEFAKFEN